MESIPFWPTCESGTSILLCVYQLIFSSYNVVGPYIHSDVQLTRLVERLKGKDSNFLPVLVKVFTLYPYVQRNTDYLITFQWLVRSNECK